MSFNDCKISESQIQTTGVQSQPDTLTGSAADNKMVFDALPTLAIQKLNSLIDQMQQQAAAGQIGVTPFDGMTAQTLQEALEQIQADIGGNYGGADGAGKVGYTPSEGVDEDTVQAAIEAVQANLTAYIAKIKAATGAAEVGNAPIAGMTATNVQQALEELRENIDNIVSGIIPGGSITSDMIQDGAVTADKLGSDVTGDTIPTSASDPTSISSQLSNKVSGSYQIYNNIAQVVESPGSTSIQDIIDAMGVHAELHALINTGVANICPSRTGSLHIVRTNQNRANILFFDNAGQLWRAETNMAEFIEWIKIVDATPPQEYDLPFADGFSNAYDNYPSTYSKTQEGLVTVIMNLKADTLSTGSVVATLPSGFRPAHNISVVSKFGTYKMGAANIYTNGNISINGPFQTGDTQFSFVSSFIADS